MRDSFLNLVDNLITEISSLQMEAQELLELGGWENQIKAAENIARSKALLEVGTRISGIIALKGF